MAKNPRSGDHFSVFDRGAGSRDPRGPGGPPPGGGSRPPRGGGPDGYGGRGGDREGIASLPPDYLKDGYFDQAGRIRKDIVLGAARDVAQTIARDRSLLRTEIAPGAIRAFFSHVRALEAQLTASADFEAIKPGIWRLQKMAEYQRQRREPPINETFIDFIARNVELAERDREHFRAFVEHFESVMAFFPRQERGRR